MDINYISTKLRTVSFLIYKESGILTIVAVRFGEIHTKQDYNAYLYYKKVIRAITYSDYLATTYYKVFIKAMLLNSYA